MSKGIIAELCLFYKIDRIPSFDILRFDIRHSSVRFFPHSAVLRIAFPWFYGSLFISFLFFIASKIPTPKTTAIAASIHTYPAVPGWAAV